MSRPQLHDALRQFGWGLRHQASRPSLARAAARYARHGWDVMPGAFFNGQRFDCGRPGCQTVGCHPAIDDWETLATHDGPTVAAWWRDLPYTVLLATGRAFDVLEVPAALGRPVFECLPREALGGPIAVTAGNRWMFLVRTGFDLAVGLAGRVDVVLHAAGSWVPAPPMRHHGGPVVWRLHPRSVGYRFADPILVQSLIIAALPQAGQRSRAIATSWPAAEPSPQAAIGPEPQPAAQHPEPAAPVIETRPARHDLANPRVNASVRFEAKRRTRSTDQGHR